MLPKKEVRSTLQAFPEAHTLTRKRSNVPKHMIVRLPMLGLAVVAMARRTLYLGKRALRAALCCGSGYNKGVFGPNHHSHNSPYYKPKVPIMLVGPWQ